MLKYKVLFIGVFLFFVFQQPGATNETLTCQVFPVNNVWNTPIDTLPVDVNSTKYINTIGANDYVHADFGSGLWDGGPIGIPFTTVPGTQQKVNVSFYYDDESDPGPYPIPADAPIEGGSNSDGDRHVLVVDRDNCILYELYDAHPQQDGSWTAGSGAVFDLNSNDLRPAGWTSADAAGLPILPGLVRYEEVAAGEINHAIRFTAPQTRKAYIWPARHYASNLTAVKYPPMGQRFRLKAGFDISGFSPDVQVILKALKKYGMILADNGSSWFISGVPDERWDNDVLHELHDVKGSDFEAVDESSLMVDPDSGEAYTGSTEQPYISLDRDELNACAVTGGASTGDQTFSISNSGEGTLNWTVTDNADWLHCSPGSGTESGTVTVSIDPSGLSTGSHTGTITVSDSNASNSPQTVSVNLTVKSASQDQAPFGDFEIPENGSTVSSSIAVSGWVLDDTGVESVKIYRGSGTQLAYIGDAILVEGARPDIETAYPGYPFNYKAGWGYMLLTNFLPNEGNGTFQLYVKAFDPSGNETTLGTKTITCDNANAVKPFGAIDTPAQGGTASGGSYRNHGWVLTPMPNSIPTDGSTIDVYVDGVNLGHPVYNVYRSDIASLFPGYANSDGAHAYFDFDTTGYRNGVHTIYWTAADDAGNTDGIGSRYFSIQNVGNRRSATVWLPNPAARGAGKGTSCAPFCTPTADDGPVRVLRGYNPNAEPVEFHPSENGNITIDTKKLERIEIRLAPMAAGIAPLYSGYLKVGGQLRPLPIGSTLDGERGIFYWQPGPGFMGNYTFVFVLEERNGKIFRRNITIKINP
jgi:hypothetical protein